MITQYFVSWFSILLGYAASSLASVMEKQAAWAAAISS
jgi:hypothetical protein